MFENVSVRQTLRFIVMLTTTIVLVVASIAFVGADLLTARAALVAELGSLAEIVGSNSAAALMFQDSVSAQEVLSALRARPAIVSACLYDKSGKAFAPYVPLKTGGAREYPLRAPRPGTRISMSRIEITRAIVFDREHVGTLVVVSDFRSVRARLLRLGFSSIGILVVALLLAFLVASRLERILSVPILELAQVADRVRKEQDFTLRANVGPRAAREIIVLNAALGDMLGGIHERDGRLRRHRDLLEEEVAARTAELRDANAELVVARDAAQRVADTNDRLSRHKQSILDTAAEGIFGLDEDGRVTFINIAAARMLGYQCADLIGTHLHNVIHQEADTARSLEECPVCSPTPQAMHVDRKAVFVSRIGNPFPVEYTAGTMQPEQHERGVVVTFRDITDRLAIERMKDEFVSTVSHELRTPLTSIRGALGLLGSGLLGSAPPRATRMLEIAVSNTDRLGRLINDILDLERMSAGRVELNRKRSLAPQIVLDSIEVVQSLVDRAGVSISFDDVAENLLWVDHDRIVQTLTNLIGNAVKFSPRGTTVRISGGIEGDSFVFAVSDEGRGIPQAKLEMIFERFKQVDASDSRDKGGSGLGLAICRSIVTAHGGRIWATSREGHGSAFHFTIPLAEETAEAPARIAIVCEKDSRLCDELRDSVRKRGYEPIIVTSLDDLPPEGMVAAVLDLSDPRTNGRRLLERVVARETRIEIPIIVAALDPPEFFGSCAEMVAAWVRMPFADDALGSALDAVVGKPAVLIVEDDVDLARVIAASLERHGVRTIHAATGAQAIEACRIDEPALVILDVILPDLDGFAVIQWMRDQGLTRVPVLVYSASDVTALDQDRLRLDRTEFLTKSRAPLSALAERVLDLLRSDPNSRQETTNAA